MGYGQRPNVRSCAQLGRHSHPRAQSFLSRQRLREGAHTIDEKLRRSTEGPIFHFSNYDISVGHHGMLIDRYCRWSLATMGRRSKPLESLKIAFLPERESICL
jgi:hypothetical protein